MEIRYVEGFLEIGLSRLLDKGRGEWCGMGEMGMGKYTSDFSSFSLIVFAMLCSFLISQCVVKPNKVISCGPLNVNTIFSCIQSFFPPKS